MIRFACLLMLLATSVLAEVQVDPNRSVVRDGWWRLSVDLHLSDITPYRVYTLDDPRRLVLDFKDVNWAGVAPDDLLEPGRATGLRFGPLRPGWSRMVVDLDEPLVLYSAEMRRVVDGADLALVLKPASAAEFAARSGAPPDPGWDALAGVDPGAARVAVDDDTLVVVIDPGHGGIDPGANRSGMREADVMLLLGQEVAAALAGVDGLQVVLTREGDVFVPLDARITMARAAGADLFISLHADALEEDEARGASVYTLTKDGGDAASRRMVARHARGDLLAGVDLGGQGDRMAQVLMDMARIDSGPQGRRFADLLVAQMRDRGVRLNARPRRAAQLAVLGAADFPAVLLEAGFLSNAADRAALADVGSRASLVRAIAAAVLAWKVG